jgi:hypothetical protein
VATFEVTTTDAFNRSQWLGPVLPETGYATVDEEIRKAEATIAGFPVRLSLDAKRTYAGGSPMHELVTINVTDLRETTADDSEFVRPAGYRNQKPIIGNAGRE